LLSTYVYSIADTELKNQMKNGSCNILTNHYEEDVSSLSFSNLKKVVEIQDKLDKERKKELESSMKKITNANVEKKCPGDKILNPNTNRCIQICGKGETRNKKNRCVKQTRKNLKKLGKSGK
jgi:hypothetical protein